MITVYILLVSIPLIVVAALVGLVTLIVWAIRWIDRESEANELDGRPYDIFGERVW